MWNVQDACTAVLISMGGFACDDKLADVHSVLAGLPRAICHAVFVDPVRGVSGRSV